MAQLSDDCFAFGGGLTPLDDALAPAGKSGFPSSREVETVGLRWRARPHSGRGHPGRPFGAAARQFRSPTATPCASPNSTPTAETCLPVIGRIAAGDAPALADPRARGAVRIFTGAVMPDGFDTVMMQEDCREDGAAVRIAPGHKAGRANRRFAGEDIEEGAVILSAGQRLRPQDLGLAASVGLSGLPVRTRPARRPVLDRQRTARTRRGSRRGPRSTTPTVMPSPGLLEQLGCAVIDLGILPDRPWRR